MRHLGSCSLLLCVLVLVRVAPLTSGHGLRLTRQPNTKRDVIPARPPTGPSQHIPDNNRPSPPPPKLPRDPDAPRPDRTVDFVMEPNLGKTPLDKRQSLKVLYMMGVNNLADSAQTELDAIQNLEGPLSPNTHSLAVAHVGERTEFQMEGPERYLRLAAFSNIRYFGDSPKKTTLVSPLNSKNNRVPSNSLVIVTRTLQWILKNYPSQYRILELMGHGAASRGMGTDDRRSPYRDHMLPMQGLAKALRDSLKTGGAETWDLVVFTACSMGAIEALYEIEPSTRYVLASQFLVTSSDRLDRQFTLEFESLVRKGLKPEELGKQLTQFKFDHDVGMGFDNAVTMDMSKLGSVVAAIRTMVQEINKVIDVPASKTALKRSQCLYRHPDLLLTCECLRDQFKSNRGLSQAAEAVLSAYKTARIAFNKMKRTSSSSTNPLMLESASSARSQVPDDKKTRHARPATTRDAIMEDDDIPYPVDTYGGVSICLSDCNSKQYKLTRFNKETGWLDMLLKLRPEEGDNERERGYISSLGA